MADFRTNQQFVTPRYPFAFGTPAGHPRLVRSPSTVTIEVKVNNALAVAAFFEKSARISRPRHIVINRKSSALDTGPPKNDDRVREVSCSFILNSALGRRIVQGVSDGAGVPPDRKDLAADTACAQTSEVLKLSTEELFRSEHWALERSV